jgi:hypothetical protein
MISLLVPNPIHSNQKNSIPGGATRVYLRNGSVEAGVAPSLGRAVLHAHLFCLPLVKNEERGGHDQRESYAEVPPEFLPQVKNRKYRENRKRYDFLNGLQLRGIEFVGADAVCRHLKTVFKKSDAPAYEDDFP